MTLCVQAVDLHKRYVGPPAFDALKGLDLEVSPGSFTALVGPSGAGKSTVLNIIGMLDVASSGKLWVLGKSVEDMSEFERDRFRRDNLGFVFQDSFLIKERTVEENVALKLMYDRTPSRTRTDLVERALEEVSMIGRAKALASELSGGEAQRVALARAIVSRPKILLADEPTGNLDSKNAETTISHFRKVASSGCTVIAVTHSAELAEAADVQIRIVDGVAR